MKYNTFNFTIFNDSITVFWKKQKSIKEEFHYNLYLNGEKVATTNKTHYTFTDLSSDTEYFIKAELEVKNNVTLIDEKLVRTNKNSKIIDVTKPPYNAVGDGVTLNTKAIQKAIDDCKKFQVVYIPKGTFLSGALTLHSDMTLYVEKGAKLLGSTSEKDYLPKIQSRFEGYEMTCYKAFINIGIMDKNASYTTKNVVIRGGGTIEGGGHVLCENVINAERLLQGEYVKSLGEKVKTFDSENAIYGRARGRLVQVSNTKNVIFDNITFKNGASWTLHFIYSKDIVTQNCYIYSRAVHNGDGWNPDSSSNLVIFNTGFETGDNCVAIKSGKNPEGNIINRPTTNVFIFDCTINSGGGFAIGSEMSGGVKDVHIWDCNAQKGLLGVRIKAPVVRGGYIENVTAIDSVMPDISITTRYGCNLDGESAKTQTTFKNFYFENLLLTGVGYQYFHYIDNKDKVNENVPKNRTAIEIIGPTESGNEIKNVKIIDCKILKREDKSTHNFELSNIKNLTLKNLNFVE